MSNLVFPNFSGMDIALKRTPIYATKIQTASSGKELRASFQSTPRYRYALPLNFLRQAVFNTDSDEAAQLLAFFDTQKGRWDSFWLSDPMAVNLIPNGTSEELNPSSPYGTAFLDNSGSNAYRGAWARGWLLGAGVPSPSNNITAPIPCVPGDQFYLEAMCKNFAGGNQDFSAEFLDSSQAHLFWAVSTPVTSATYAKCSSIVTAPAGAAFIRFYIESHSGTISGWYWFDNIFACRMSTAGLVAIPDGSLTQVILSADGLYMQMQRKVRFDTDELDFERFLAQVWEAKNIPFISVK